MRKRIIKNICLAALIAVMILTAGCSGSGIRFGTAATGGVYYLLSTKFADVLSRDGMQVSPKDTAGSAANIRLLSDGYLDIGLAQSDLINEMYFGRSYGLDRNYRGYTAIAALYSEYVQIVVRKDSDITSIDDLDGHSISIGQDESGTERDATQILSAYGLDSNSVTEGNYDYTDAMENLLDGDIDLMFVTAGLPSEILEKNADKIRFISLDDTRRNRILSTFDGFQRAVIPAGTYTGQDYDIETISVNAVLLAADSLSSETVYNVTKALFESRDELEEAAGLEFMDEKEAGSSLNIPLHPGAAAWYLDEGVAIPEVESSGETSDDDDTISTSGSNVSSETDTANGSNTGVATDSAGGSDDDSAANSANGSVTDNEASSAGGSETDANAENTGEGEN